MSGVDPDRYAGSDLDLPDGACVTDQATLIERICRRAHDAYEEAAVAVGWSTQEASRKPWRDVPEANQRTMRRAMAAVLDMLAADGLLIDGQDQPDAPDEITRLREENARLSALVKAADEYGAMHGCDPLSYGRNDAESAASPAGGER